MDSASRQLLQHITYVLLRRKYMIVLSTVIVFATCLFFIWLITPTFRASDKILVHNNYKQQLGMFNDITSPGQVNPHVNWANNVIEIASGQVMAETLVKQFKLDERYRQKVEDPQTPRDSIKAAIGAMIQWPAVKLEEMGIAKRKPVDYVAEAAEEFLEDALDIELVEDTEIVDIGIYEDTPERANAMVGALTELLIAKTLGLDRNAAQSAYSFSEAQTLASEQEYQAAMRKLEAFKLARGVTSFADEKILKLERRERFADILSGVQNDLAEKRAELDRVNKSLRGSGLDPAQYKELGGRAVELDIEIAALEGRSGQLRQNIADADAEILRLIESENEYLRMERDAALKEELFLKLQTRQGELLVQTGTDLGEFSLKTVDQVRIGPYADADWPDLKILVPLIVVFSLGAGLAVAFLVELFLDYPRTRDELEASVGVKVRAAIPQRRLWFKALAVRIA